MRMRSWMTLLLAGALIAAGCASGSVSRVDRNWGSAVRDNAEAMIANPDGSPPDHDPGSGITGPSEQVAMQKFRQDQHGAKDAAVAPTINMVTLGGAGK